MDDGEAGRLPQKEQTKSVSEAGGCQLKMLVGKSERAKMEGATGKVLALDSRASQLARSE